VRYWSEDESRIGLHTMSENKVDGFRNKTASPSAMGFHLFVALGIGRAANWRVFFYEFTHLDTVCFEKFLELFASKYPRDLHIVQVDQVGFHNYLTNSRFVPGVYLEGIYLSASEVPRINHRRDVQKRRVEVRKPTIRLRGYPDFQCTF
jgi:hypothetical protein